MITPSEIEIQSDMTYEEEPIRILAREVKELRNKKIPLVKVLWHRDGVEKATWEPKDSMRRQYSNILNGPKKCQQSFNQLKALLTEAPVLVQPESSKEFVIYSDVSLNYLGFVLIQEGKVVNYPTHDLELAAIVFALKIWRHHLYGEKCHIFADHMSLNNLQAKRVQCESTSDSEYQIGSDDCLMFRDKIFVPKNSELIQKILHEAHRGCLSVHPVSTKMYNDLKKSYWRSGMKRDISKFVSKCLICQQVKAEHQVPSSLLQPVMIP
ncbi:DNA/RNA polymerases superfamily protein [Gossypium australe]|uniref:DNA/RNA polymerases superfamily protein n=1 Tax=Gossypium australe TaxID=47621 RepID=A0A5B6WGG1_9ROSI|nr:DNA/RNA polymerases superfamily protein [Gossypium australe]